MLRDHSDPNSGNIRGHQGSNLGWSQHWCPTHRAISLAPPVTFSIASDLPRLPGELNMAPSTVMLTRTYGRQSPPRKLPLKGGGGEVSGMWTEVPVHAWTCGIPTALELPTAAFPPSLPVTSSRAPSVCAHSCLRPEGDKVGSQMLLCSVSAPGEEALGAGLVARQPGRKGKDLETVSRIMGRFQPSFPSSASRLGILPCFSYCF